MKVASPIKGRSDEIWLNIMGCLTEEIEPDIVSCGYMAAALAGILNILTTQMWAHFNLPIWPWIIN